MKNDNQCGKCCIKYGDGGLTAARSEIRHWEEFRPDIAAYIQNGNLWADPQTGKRLDRCPWLRQVPGQAKYTCDIYEDRPEE